MPITETYNLTQKTHNTTRSKNRDGIVNRISATFSDLLPDGLEVNVIIRGNEEAFIARFGTWGFGLEPPAELKVAITPLGIAISDEIMKKSAPKEPSDIEQNILDSADDDTDEIIKELDSI